AGTRMAGLGQTIVDVGHKYNLRSDFIAAHIAIESAYNSSTIAKLKNNLTGFGADDKHPFEDAKTYFSPAASIDDYAHLIRFHYANQGADHYHADPAFGVTIADLHDYS